jgi:hypothetical protein
MEEEGLPTTQISLIREHTERINPPRALWVPFELGRPLGVPNDATFQKRVLIAALKLLEASSGPVLEAFPEEAPGAGESVGPWACPVSFPTQKADLDDQGQLREELQQEIRQLSSWYDMAVKRRGRTTVGLSGMAPHEIGDFVVSFLGKNLPENPREDFTLGEALKLASEDLKAYYFEGVEEQPGQSVPTSEQLADWFWGETAAGKTLLAVKEVCVNSDEKFLQLVGKLLLVPMAQGKRSA